MAGLHVAESATKRFNVLGQQAQTAVGQVDGEKIGPAGDKISPVAGHRRIV
jgi:hypothetical protein